MIRIQPKEYINSDFVKDYYYYSKVEALKLYLQEFQHFKKKDLRIS